MPRRPTLIVCSLLANIALAATLYCLHQQNNSSPPTSRAASTNAKPARDAVPISQVWQAIDTGVDDASFVARLRNFGFPERAVRSLVRFRIEQKYADQVRALTSPKTLAPYWQTSRYTENVFNPEARAKLRAIQREVSAHVRAILGPSADQPLPGDFSYHEQRRFGDLSPDKIAALKAIQRDYADLANQVEEASQGILFPEDREKLVFLENEEQADLAQLLSPEELEQYERRTSFAAYETREALQYLEGVTEEDFLKLYRLRHDFDLRYGLRNLSPAQHAIREKAKSELNAQIETALGPERYAEYQIVNDKNYKATRDFVIESGLPADVAKSLVLLQRNSVRKAAELRSDKSLTGAQLTESLRTLDAETRASLTASLGPGKAATYQNYSAGNWLSKLVSAAEKPAK